MRRSPSEVGFTLIEMLVSISLVAILGGLTTSLLLTTQNTAKAGKQEQDTNEEARLALNRMARELRQATSLMAVRNADGSGYSATDLTAVTFTADFNNDGCISDGGAGAAGACSPQQPLSATDPEILTYCYQPVFKSDGSLDASKSQVYLRAGTLPSTATTCASGASVVPLLAGNVTLFKLTYRSNLYLYDTNPADGVTSWEELDQAGPPVGNADGQLDNPDLANIDSVLIDMSLLEGQHKQDYETQVDLRNLSR